MSNYTKIDEKYIDEIDAKMVVYSHNKTKARVATIECDDDNKVFSIAFRTPPIDNTGLTHILEHSVLCGSDKYPVKDPFVELLKSSLNTFLNAFTFPDKTMYPCASKNDKDFKNLMDVYMDAVFHPNIYKHKEIFLQEGWHHHLENKDDDITYNGVVDNEMKGAFSDPQEILARIIKKSLFPDNQYQYESGGDPKYIPDLTYESFLDFHSKYYSASNSYIFIYGNCDMEERLEFLDREYLSKMDYVDFDTKIDYQKQFKQSKFKTEYYEASGDLNNKTFLSYNFTLPTTLDNKMIIATDILISSLFNVVGAPIKEAIIKNNIGSEVDVTFEVDLLQPIVSVVVSNSNSNQEEKFIELVEDELNKLIKKGFNKESILSIINHEEFLTREKAFSPGMPKGIMVIINSMSTWLYDDNNPWGKLELISYYKELKEDLNNGYFENLAKKLFIDNKNKSFVKLVPQTDYSKKENDKLQEKLKKYKKSLSIDEIDNIVKETEGLNRYQSTPDSIEALNSLPKLELKDILEKPENYNLDVVDGKYKTLYSNYRTNGISYSKYYFDLTDINDEDLKYLNLYTIMLKRLNTKKHSYFELNEIIRNNLGGLSFNIYSYITMNRETKVMFSILASYLDDNMHHFSNLLNEVLYETDFSDEKRMYEIIAETKASIETGVSGKGHVISLNRSMSFYNKSYHINDLLSGIEYIDFIKDLYDNFDDRKNTILEKFNKFTSLFSKTNFMAGYTGSELEGFKKYTDEFYNGLVDSVSYEKDEYKPNIHSEAIKTPFNVNFVSLSGYTDEVLDGSADVLHNLLSLDYLWDRIRVHGGAYGAMLKIDDVGNIGFVSYRDPNIDSTIDNYLKVSEYIDSLDFSDEELLKYKIGAIGNKQLVLHNKDKAELARSLYLRGVTYKMREDKMDSLVNAKLSDLKKISKVIKEVIDKASICVVAANDGLDKSKLEFDDIREL